MKALLKRLAMWLVVHGLEEAQKELERKAQEARADHPPRADPLAPPP